jgi:hypothetical protein
MFDISAITHIECECGCGLFVLEMSKAHCLMCGKVAVWSNDAEVERIINENNRLSGALASLEVKLAAETDRNACLSKTLRCYRYELEELAPDRFLNE